MQHEVRELERQLADQSATAQQELSHQQSSAAAERAHAQVHNITPAGIALYQEGQGCSWGILANALPAMPVQRQFYGSCRTVLEGVCACTERAQLCDVIPCAAAGEDCRSGT